MLLPICCEWELSAGQLIYSDMYSCVHAQSCSINNGRIIMEFVTEPVMRYEFDSPAIHKFPGLNQS